MRNGKVADAAQFCIGLIAFGNAAIAAADRDEACGETWARVEGAAGMESKLRRFWRRSRFYSLLMSPIANGLQPIEYLEKVIEELPACKTQESMKSLLPHKVEPAMSLAVDIPFDCKIPS